jgi:long-subunit fatty acid transport protein
MQRQRAVKDGPVEDIFRIGSITGMSTVTTLEARNLNSLIMHNFGLVSTGIEEFYGLDQNAAVRLGFDYGVTDELTIGIGRTSVEDNVDFRAKYLILKQLESDKIPVQIAIKGDVGINTQKNTQFDEFTFQERLNYFASVMIARKFNKQLSLQIAPMVSHFNTVKIERVGEIPENTHYGLGIGGRYAFDERKAITFEYLPVIGDRSPGTKNHFALGYEIETGGHVFQMFFMSGKWFTEQHLLARTNTNFFEGDFRLGFNINRVFGL